MSDLISTINTADALARLWREGKLISLELAERLTALGFYAIVVGDFSTVAWFNGVRFEL